MTNLVALISEPTHDYPAHAVARDAIALASVALAHDRRFLIHAPSVVLAPVLVSAGFKRSSFALEEMERAPAPIVLMPRGGGKDLEDQALFDDHPIGQDDRRESLISRMAISGFVDDRWRSGEVDSASILMEERPTSIFAMGFSETQNIYGAAESLRSEDHQVRLIALGDESYRFAEREGWQTEANFSSEYLPNIRFEDPSRPGEYTELRDLSDDYRGAWEEAQRKAYLVLLLEAFFASAGREYHHYIDW